MNKTLWLAAGALAASAPLLAQNAAPLSTPPEDFKVLDKEVGVSGDFLYGNGYVQLPVGEALFRGSGDRPFDIGVGKFTTADRKSAVYYGGTLSGSIGKTWYIDVSYSRGTTKGSLNDLQVFGFGTAEAFKEKPYNLSDQYYQLYLKYAFPQFSGTRFAAYLRIGATYSENSAHATYTGDLNPFTGVFDSQSNDYLGNIGAGIEYYVYRGESFKVTSVFEGEAFGGIRRSTIEESLAGFSPRINHESIVYGALGRGVFRFVKSLDREGRWKLNADLGLQGKYLINEYDSLANEINVGPGLSRKNVHSTELLWGPYGRIGLSYSF